jgi:hypothetical protein
MPIDGKDDRYNYWDPGISDEQRKNADSVGMIIPTRNLTYNNDGTYKIDTIAYGENCSLCCQDRFYYEPVIQGGMGTCFAVDGEAGNLIVTARHIIDIAIELGYVRSLKEFIRDYCVVFGYVAGRSVERFPGENIYYLNDEYNDTYSRLERKPEDDFTIFKVNRKVQNRVLLNSNEDPIKKRSGVYIPGHPLKMLLKVILNGKIKALRSILNKSQLPNEQYFTVSSDIFLYSSGSPVFDISNHQILGMVTANGNGSDFVNICCSCKKNRRDYRRMEKGTSSNFVLRIERIKQYI